MTRALLSLGLFLFVWPAVTGLTIALDASGTALPLGARTAITSALLVPTMVYAVVPALTRALARF